MDEVVCGGFTEVRKGFRGHIQAIDVTYIFIEGKFTIDLYNTNKDKIDLLVAHSYRS